MEGALRGPLCRFATPLLLRDEVMVGSALTDPITYAAFADELQKIAQAEKDSGFIDDAAHALTRPIPGTKPWLLGRNTQAVQNVVKKAPVVTKSRGNIHDVSSMAAQMGL